MSEGTGFDRVEPNGNTFRENSMLATGIDPLHPNQPQAPNPFMPFTSSTIAVPHGKGVPFWVSLLIWGGLIYAFLHIPYMTQGPFSGLFDFTLLAVALLITAPRLRGITLGCLMPFVVLGFAVLFGLPGLILGHLPGHPQHPKITPKLHKQHKPHPLPRRPF